MSRQTVMAVLAQDELGEVEKIKYFVEPDTHFVRFVILYSTVSSLVESFEGARIINIVNRGEEKVGH